MKQTEKFFSHACMYTVFISIAFYIFSSFVNAKGLSMTFARFLTVFSFSLVISSMEFVFAIPKIPKAVGYLINYVTLCIAFNVVFFTIRKSNSDFVFDSSTIFAATILFSFGYGFVILMTYVVRKIVSGINLKKNKVATPTEYKSRFK